MLTAAQIRQQFLDFFREKQHTIVPSASLMPDSPNLLFTNAGMNQFVPIFLGEKKADVSKWGGAIPGSDTRAADTQKCIRAGGKHNDLDDVGLDTYHHTFFEMLGNWSFGDYFKKEAIAWSWELIVERFKFPPNRVYATIYQPDPGDPSERDQESWELWAERFRSVGFDPDVHIVNGNKKDNFWMMGETGPCGPCSEIHIDLTPEDRTPELEVRGSKLVNAGVPECIEIWNNVFIQFNAQPSADSSTAAPKIEFVPLAQQHVDTGMGFERLTSIIQGTKEFTDFGRAKISNYETDIFRPIFDELEKLSGKRYASTLPGTQASSLCGPQASSLQSTTGGQDARRPHRQDAGVPADQIVSDVAFRVIADHIRTLSFAIADGIQPGNTDRNYVLRRILRRAVRYGRSLGFKEPFFYKLVAVLARTMGDVFPEIRAKQKQVEETLKREEEAFNKTLDRGIALFEAEAARLTAATPEARAGRAGVPPAVAGILPATSGPENATGRTTTSVVTGRIPATAGETPALPAETPRSISGVFAFTLYDTYGFPLDLTELMARERGLTVDVAGFEKHMEAQRARARAAQKKQVIELSEIETKEPTRFVGYDALTAQAQVVEVVTVKDRIAVILDTTAAYAEMGGQVGDTGELSRGAETWPFVTTQKSGATWLHFLGGTGRWPVVSGGPPETSEVENAPVSATALPPGAPGGPPAATGRRPVLPIAFDTLPVPGDVLTVSVDPSRRRSIQRHHTVTHLLHWALHEVVSKEATQKGSFVGPDKLTFDFNSAALTPAQVRDIERLVNERIVENAAVSWIEVPYAEVRGRSDIMQFFGDKYGETVRVVQIGGAARALDGYSMELCAGTHTRATGEIGLFRIASEAAIAAGVRRIEAQAGLSAYDLATTDTQRLHALATKIGTPLPELEKRIEGLLAQQKELERALKAASQREAAGRAKDLLASAQTINGIPAIIANLTPADGDILQTVADALKSHGFKGVTVLGGSANGSVALVAAVTSDFTAKVQAGKIISAVAPLVGGKGGGKPEAARGGGKDPSQLDAALAHAKTLLG